MATGAVDAILPNLPVAEDVVGAGTHQ